MNSKITLLAAATVVAACLFGDDSVTTDRFPDADSVIVDESEKVRYNPDGTYEAFDESFTKILTEKGRRSESTVTLDYSKRYGEAAITYVGIIAADGSEREVDISKTMKEATDNGSMSVNIYDPLDRKIVATVPGLKIGDALHVKTHRKTLKPRCEGKWADLSVMEWSHPIIRSTYEVTAPKSLPLKKIAIRHPLGNIVTNVIANADGSTTYSFVATNSAQVFPEPDMPPLYTQVQNVRVSTSSSWPEISKWYWKISEPHLVKTNAAMVAMVRLLTGEEAVKAKAKAKAKVKAKVKAKIEGKGDVKAKSEMEKIRSIFKFVSQEIRYMGLTLEDTSPGYSPHDVCITFDNRYGVCRDKAALLVAMLRLAGIKAFPVLIHVGAKLDPVVPQPFFNHAIVAVECSGGTSGSPTPIIDDYLLMDPTNENTKDLFPAYLCNNSFIVCRPEGETLMTSPVPSPDLNRLDVKTDATLAKDGSMFVECEVTMNGINDTAYRGILAKRTPEERVRTFERVVKMVNSGAELVRCEIEPKDMRDTEKKIRIRLAMRLQETLMKGETADELTVPFFTKVLGMANFLLRGNTSLAERKYPLVLDTTTRVSETVTIDLGGVVGAVKKLPADVLVGSGNSFSRTFTVRDGRLIAKRDHLIGAVEFNPKEYQQLREDIKTIEQSERERPVFLKDELADADIRMRLFKSDVRTFGEDAKSWVMTNTYVKEVLTYAGKKSSAELKYGYNPTWKHVELLSAVVSNRNGKIAKVTPKEMNVMDAGWVSSAPRYPASKLLVVNLPSVEIGSVISYTVVTTVSNAPTAAYFDIDLDTRNSPVDRLIASFNEWKCDIVKPRRVPKEVAQPDASLWRNSVIISSNVFETTDMRIANVCGLPDELHGLKAIRDWMAMYVKIAGPSLYALRLEDQLTDADVVLKERYASRLDYMRTLAALLRADGYDADVVFAANNAGTDPAIRHRMMHEKPNVEAFSIPLVRVTVSEGGFLGFGATEKVYFLGTENQYAEIGATAYEGSDYYDPESGEFGLVTVPAPELLDREVERSVYAIRDDGSVDLDVVDETYGSGVAGFRKRYSEILPEERSRLYQAILGSVSQAATATKDLETDVESYPATRKFSCFIPKFATVSGDTMSITIPPLASSIGSLTGSARETPFAVGACDPETEEVTIRFPAGYTRVEHLPAQSVFADPHDKSRIWMETVVVHEVKDGALEVKITRQVLARGPSWYRPEYFELFKDYSRIDRSSANRTVSARK